MDEDELNVIARLEKELQASLAKVRNGRRELSLASSKFEDCVTEHRHEKARVQVAVSQSQAAKKELQKRTQELANCNDELRRIHDCIEKDVDVFTIFAAKVMEDELQLIDFKLSSL